MSWASDVRAEYNANKQSKTQPTAQTAVPTWAQSVRSQYQAEQEEKRQKEAAIEQSVEQAGRQALAQSFSPQSADMVAESLKLRDAGYMSAEEQAKKKTSFMQDAGIFTPQTAVPVQVEPKETSSRPELKYAVAKNEWGLSDHDATVYAATDDADLSGKAVLDSLKNTKVSDVMRRELTDEEQKNLREIRAFYGADAADEYLSSLGSELVSRPFAKMADESPFFASAASVAINLASGLGIVEDAAKVISGQEINPYSAIHLPSHAVSAIRSTVASKTDSEALQLLYGVTMSIADMAMAMFATGGFTGAGAKSALAGNNAAVQMIMSSQAATASCLEAKQRGCNDRDSVILGVFSGLFEGLTEKMSGGLTWSPSSKIGKFLLDMGMEGMEEVGATTLNEFAQTVVDWENSDRNLTIQYYMETEGMSYEDAMRASYGDYLLDLAKDGLSGMLAGGLMSAPISISTVRQNNRQKIGTWASEAFAPKFKSPNADGTTMGQEGSNSWVAQSRARAAAQSGDDVRAMKPISGDVVQGAQATFNISESEKTALSSDETREEMEDFYRSVLAMKSKNLRSKRRQTVGVLNERHAATIQKILSEIGLDIDVTGWNVELDGSAIQHIDDRHGAQGEADHSMSTAEDVGLIPSAIDAAKDGFVARKQDGTLDLDYQYRNADGSPSAKIVLSVPLGSGTMFVAECVPDSAAKTIHIKSAYKNSGSNAQKLLMESVDSPQPTSETFDGYNASALDGSLATATDAPINGPLSLTPETTAGTASSFSIPQSGEVVNQNGKNSSAEWFSDPDTAQQTAREWFADDGAATSSGTAQTAQEGVQSGSEGVSKFNAHGLRSDASNWSAENRNAENGAVVSLDEIVSDIKNEFGVTINKGKFRQQALGIFRNRSESIRTRMTNDVPVIAHELGHYLDKRFRLTGLPSAQTAVDVMQQTDPAFAQAYSAAEVPSEAVAEFVRRYMTDRTGAQRDYGAFFNDFVDALANDGGWFGDNSSLAKLNSIADKVNAYVSADPLDRARAAVYSGEEARKIERKSEGAKRMAERIAKSLYTKTFDDYAPLNEAGKNVYNRQFEAVKANVIAEGIAIGDRMVDQTRNAAPMRDVNGNAMTDETGTLMREKSLVQVLDPLFGEKMTRKQQQAIEADFNTYLVLRRSMELPNITVFADSSLDTPAETMSMILDMEARHPEFSAVAEELYRWQRSFLYTWGVQTGIVSIDTFNALGEKYHNYVPLQRHVKTAKGKQSNGGGSVIKTIRGSGADIINPVDSIAANICQLVRMAERNAVYQELARNADTIDGFSVFAEKVTPDMRRVSISIDAILQAAQEADGDGAIDIVNAIEGGVLGDSVSEWQRSDRQRADILTVMLGGRAEYYQIHNKPLLEALTKAGKHEATGPMKWIAAASRTFKSLVTGWNTVWSLTNNMQRDIGTGYRYSVEGDPAKYLAGNVKAAGQILSTLISETRGSEAYKQYKAAGGGYSAYVAQNTKSLNTLMSKVYQQSPGTLKGKFMRALEIVEAINDTVEQAPRFAEYQRALKGGATQAQAVYAADESTTNFARGGSWMRQIDNIMPYTNAAVQGLYRAGKEIKTHPKEFALKTGITAILGTALVYAWNGLTGGEDEYEKLSQRTKNDCYCFHVGNGYFLKIHKPRELGFLQTLTERAIEDFVMDNPDAWKDFEDYLLDCFMPLNLDPQNLTGDMVILGTFSDLRANENYAGAPIVPAAYENLPKEEQYDDSTSKLAYALGQWLGWSPMQIDYWINDNLGIIGKVNSMVTVGGLDASALGVGRNFFADNAYSNNAVNALYEEQETYNTAANGKNATGSDLCASKAYDAAVGTISAVNKYGKNTDEERACKILARDTALAFREGFQVDEDLAALYNRTGDAAVSPYASFGTEFTYDGVKYSVSAVTAVSMWNDYNGAISPAVDEILESGMSDEEMVAALAKAKSQVKDAVKAKYAAIEDGEGDPQAGIYTNAFGMSNSDYAVYRTQIANITSDKDEDGKAISGSKKAKICAAIDDFCDEHGLSKEVKYRLYAAEGYGESSAKDTDWFSASDRYSDYWDDIFKDD